MNKNRAEAFLTPEGLEKQEHLSFQRLNQLRSKNVISTTGRPTANFIDLMNWVAKSFQDSLIKGNLKLNKFVHNRIIVDGQFLQFCEERNISIECLYNDSFISWKTDHNFEKFFAQGVFLIKSKEVEFLHCALFHKGANSEDEVSFFIICDQSQYEEYLNLRNEFDRWVEQRDRSNLHIRVIDGEDLPYSKDHSWDDLFLPDQIKNEIKLMVEDFLSSKDFYLQNKISWKRGMILHGLAGNGKTSIIRTIMSVYNFKPITITANANDDAIREAFSYAEEQSPSLLYFEDLDSLLDGGINPSSFLNLMDGISTKNGMFIIATANEIKKLKANIVDRPSRFDRKFEIPLPDAAMAYRYLKTWFGNLISVKKGKELAKYAEKNRFSYAYLKEVYVSSMFEALAHGRKVPTEKDIMTALNRIIKDKKSLNNGSVSLDKYFD